MRTSSRRQVVAGRHARLLEQDRVIGLGDHLAVDSDHDVEIGGRDGDGVTWVHGIANRSDRPEIPTIGEPFDGRSK